MPARDAPARRRAEPRWVELVLLALAGAATLAASATLVLAAGGPATATALAAALGPAVALIGIFAATHVGLCFQGRDTDAVILPACLTLMGLGLALSLRLAPALSDRQVVWVLLGAGVVGTTALARFDVGRLQRYRYTWAIAGIGLVALTLVAGRSVVPGGPRLWLGLGPLTFQPSEALKLLLVVFLAGYLEDKRELLAKGSVRVGRWRVMPWPYLAPLTVILGLSLALLVAQRDLGAALLLFAIALGMLYLASGRATYVVAGLALFAGGAWWVYHHFGVVHTRVAIWLDPWRDPSNSGYQPIQGLMGLAAGGVFGAGLGLGAPTLIPAVHTDFVYAAVAEELGLAGAAAVLGVYAVLFARGFRAAARAARPFDQLLAAGLTFALAVQTLIIVGGVLRLIPLTGITLPFLSHGGTSMLACAAAVGVILRVSRSAA